MNDSNIVMYTTEDGLTKIDVTFEEDTVWLSLEQMAELFQRDKSTISRHIKNVFSERELRRETTVANFATVQMEGNRQVSRDIEYYNLDVIISVGYRVKSLRGTQFRIWASTIMKEYMKKGFALDDDLLDRRFADFDVLNALRLGQPLQHPYDRQMGEIHLEFEHAVLPIKAPTACKLRFPLVCGNGKAGLPYDFRLVDFPGV